jgi:hypothetical protein
MRYADERAYFESLRHQEGSLKMGYGSSYSQSYRYGLLVRDLDLRGKRCMLLGCGEGAGVPFLEARGCEDIVGFDLLDGNIREARSRYGRHSFAVVEGTTDAFRRVERVDYVVASGVWNVKTERDSYEKVRELLQHTPQIRCGLATNFTCDVAPDDEAFSFNYFTILELFVTRFRRWKIDHTYFEKDFSIWGLEPSV